MTETKQRLSGLDWQFLGIEDKSQTHMHIGSQLILAGPPPGEDSFLEFISSRIHLAPRFRQKLQSVPGDAGKPFWVDDPDFRLDEQVVSLALAAPGSRKQLDELTGEVFSHRLDRSRPLWRMWYIEGLEGGNWGIIMKMHHAMVDGLGAIDLFAALLDLGPEGREVPADDHTPEPSPRKRDTAKEQVRRTLDRAKDAGKSLTSMIANPGEAGPKIYDVAKGMAETAQAALPIAPSTVLNPETGPWRGFVNTDHPLAEYKAIKNALGGTINDVVLSVSADALGRYLRHLGVDTDGMELRAEVPSSIRSSGEQQGNMFVVLAVQLPVGEMPAAERYAIVRDRMEAVKSSDIGTAVGTILQATNFLPPTLLAQTSRLVFSKLLFNVLISNVPGVQIPVYLHGSQLLNLSPLPWVGPQQALSIACMSYNGTLSYGFMYDRDAVRDAAKFADYMDASAADLLAAASG